MLPESSFFELPVTGPAGAQKNTCILQENLVELVRHAKVHRSGLLQE